MKLTKLTSTAVVILALGGCTQQQLAENNAPDTEKISATKPQRSQAKSNPRFAKISPLLGKQKKTAAPNKKNDAWLVIKNELAFANTVPDRKISEQLDWLDGNQEYFDNTLGRANIYLPYVLDRVISAGLPSEVALLPFIESAYNPLAISPSGAAGLWQFIPNTGKHFGLHEDRWFHARRDIIESTDAAIRYIQALNTQFNGDWLLTFAAYNGGPGTVQRAIEANQRKGLDTDFWSLDLSQQTQHYVPRLVALSKVITQPDKYGIERMSIPAAPNLQVIELNTPIDLAQAAKIAGVSNDHMQKLNPGYSRWITPPSGPARILLPSDKADGFLAQLSGLPANALLPKQEYVVQKGDTLSGIARRNGTSVVELTSLNGLGTNSMLKLGQVIRIPGSNANSEAPTYTPPSALASEYKVKSGDSLWSIAKAHNLSTKDLLAWNGLTINSTIQPGQVLQFQQSNQRAKEPTSNYEVKKGDSLYNIAKQFQVQIHDLLAWNDLGPSSLLRPGQQLRIYSGN